MGLRDTKSQQQGWELGYSSAEGQVLDERDPRDCSEPQFWLCWEQDKHKDYCRALGCPGNPVGSLSPGNRHRALHSAQNPWGAAQPPG